MQCQLHPRLQGNGNSNRKPRSHTAATRKGTPVCPCPAARSTGNPRSFFPSCCRQWRLQSATPRPSAAISSWSRYTHALLPSKRRAETVLERERPAPVVPLFTEASQNTCPSTSLNAAAVSMPGHGNASPRHVSNCAVLHLPHCRSRRGEAGGSARLSNELPSPTTPAPHLRQLTSRPRS